VVFGGPDVVKPTGLGDLDHFKGMARDVFHIQTVVNPFHIHSKLEFHVRVLSGGSVIRAGT
jgi:hypothetical protein